MLPDETDDEFLRRVLAGPMPEVPAGLASRIVAHATAQPQRQGLLGWMRRAFTEWDYALNVKGMALAGFAMLGLLSAQLGAHQTFDLRNVLYADPNWTEEL